MFKAIAKKIIAAALVAALAAGVYAYHESNKPLVIGLNPGGSVGQFIEEYDVLRRSGRTVIIDGICISACTLILGLVPLERVCVTPFAKMAFHSASAMMGSHSPEGTRLVWRIYPEKVRTALIARGWNGESGAAHPDLIYIDGDDLSRILTACPA